MHSKTSRTALTTRHTARTFGRPRITTVFNPPAPADPARDLVAAIYAWGRIAVPVADPGPCPVQWCTGCMWSGDEEDARLHQSAAVIVEALEHDGTPIGRVRHTGDHTLRVTVERCDGGTKGDEPAIVHVYLGRAEGPDLGTGKARELATALRKAKTSATELLYRDGVTDGTTGAVSVVRVRNYTVQVGAIFDDGTATVYINYVRTYTAAEVRDQARHALNPLLTLPECWDLLPVEAGQLAAAVDAAAVLADADRAATAVAA